MADDHEELVSQFCALTGASPTQATQYLSGTNWDLDTGVSTFLQDQEEGSEEPEPAAAASPEPYTGPRTLDGRPAPQSQSAFGRSSAAGKPAKKKGIATLGSLASSGGHGHGHDHDDDDDEDDDDFEEDERKAPRDLFAGGEKSALAVQDPAQQQGGGSKKIINDILAKAKANASRPEANPASGGSSSSTFRGSGQTLGGDGVVSRTIPDPQGPRAPRPAGPAQTGEAQERVLHLWLDGFSIDDGPLRRYDDAENAMDLQMIRQGRAPLHLMNVRYDQPVDVKLQQHEENFRQLPKIYRPFGGEGRRLGSPVPGDAAVAAPPVRTAAPAASTSAAGSAAQVPTVNTDSSLPAINLRIQLPDGTRLPARFNTTHTLEDVYQFVSGASPATRTRPWVLATTFPNKEHTDRSLVLGDLAELKKGGTVVVKWT